MADEKYWQALGSLVDAKDETARLRAELAQVRKQIQLAFWEGAATGGGIVADFTSRNSVKKRIEERWRNSVARAFMDSGDAVEENGCNT